MSRQGPPFPPVGAAALPAHATAARLGPRSGHARPGAQRSRDDRTRRRPCPHCSVLMCIACFCFVNQVAQRPRRSQSARWAASIMLPSSMRRSRVIVHILTSTWSCRNRHRLKNGPARTQRAMQCDRSHTSLGSCCKEVARGEVSGGASARERGVRSRLGWCTVIGAAAHSFGIPERPSCPGPLPYFPCQTSPSATTPPVQLSLATTLGLSTPG